MTGPMRHFVRCAIISLAVMLAAGVAAGSPPTEQLLLRTYAARAKPFRPNLALGAAIDGTQRGGVDRVLTARNIAAMKRAGLRSLSYRLRTELGIEAWHWNPHGQWSDPVARQGYWTSSDVPGTPIRLSWGYRLPRRGDTVDQANDRGYSRLTDGDLASFWKSNPYLDPGGAPRRHAASAVAGGPLRSAAADRYRGARLGDSVRSALRSPVLDRRGRGRRRWPVGDVSRRPRDQRPRRPGEAEACRAAHCNHSCPRPAEEGSGTAPPGASDWRNRAGFAVREVSFGLQGRNGAFADAVVHAPSHAKQTFAHVSSTDPWHRAIDRDPDLEQAGIDRIFASGLTAGQPIMMATGLLYDTPDNVAAELRYIARRHYHGEPGRAG